MDRTEERQGSQESQESEGLRVPLETFGGGGGGGCSCGCCGPADTGEAEPADREREIAELKELREATEQRLAELDAE